MNEQKDDRFLNSEEVKSLEILEVNEEFKRIVQEITGSELRLTQLKCGTWVFIPMFPAKE
jgi:hypothetical protein